MTSTIYKRRSINLDDRTYKRGKLLAKSQTVSLSALLRLLINGAYSSSSGVELVGLTSTPATCESNRPDRSVIILPDAEDVHLLGIDTVGIRAEYQDRSEGTPKTINTYDFSADSEQSSL
jgi:hypothetical protein